MEPKHIFVKVLEYIYLFLSIFLLVILFVLHFNFINKPGCSSELSGVLTSDAQLISIKITGVDLLTQNGTVQHVEDISSEQTVIVKPRVPNAYDEYLETQSVSNSDGKGSKLAADSCRVEQEETCETLSMFSKQYVRAAFLHLFRKCLLPQTLRIISGIHLDLDVPKLLQVFHLDTLNLIAVQWLERKIKAFEWTYVYTMERGYLLLPEKAKTRHNIQTANISISARHPCFGNRWQQLLISRVVGYDTILLNSLLAYPGQGYLYNQLREEFYNLSSAHHPSKAYATFGDYLATKCAVLMMSLFVFFIMSKSVSFTFREIQTRMLNFTVHLHHHERHQLPTFHLKFVHVIELLVSMATMLGIFNFLYGFYHDQLLSYVVFILVWLSELLPLSFRTPISRKFFPRFFFLYFLAFHIYFFSYAYGFLYLALTTTGAFMMHLFLYLWNRIEIYERSSPILCWCF